MRYTVVLEREEDGGYVASVPALPGCVSQGDTRAEALKNIQEATLATPCPPRQARSSSRSRQREGGRCPRHHVAKLPTDLSGRDVRAALERVGFVFRRQAGSHMMLRRDRPYARVVVPDHKQVRLGTLRRIIADAGLTVEQFVELLRR
jgi:predicted RNA binding protein YcfA (HicA-like mRNA interferase family)